VLSVRLMAQAKLHTSVMTDAAVALLF